MSRADDIRRLLREGRSQAEVVAITQLPVTTVAYHARVLAVEAARRADDAGDRGAPMGSWRR